MAAMTAVRVTMAAVEEPQQEERKHGPEIAHVILIVASVSRIAPGHRISRKNFARAVAAPIRNDRSLPASSMRMPSALYLARSGSL
jgi:hypothetical protein